ncbi:MAG: glutathione S-transferase family protein [Myxococcales bacterium]|nr:glutathione S-transferase family protein [Myxococcales bacterium]
MSLPKLYHFHLSYAAQIARLGLAEKGVAYDGFSIDLLGGENYEPWYMEINPKGVVPTFVSDQDTVVGSLNIVRFADAHFPGPQLTPTDQAKRDVMEAWIARHQAVPERELTYALLPGFEGKMARKGFPDRIKILQKNKDKQPHLAEMYDQKIADLKRWEHDCNDPETVQKMEAELDALFDDFSQHIADRTWVTGDEYSVADVLWTVLVARMHMMGIGHKVTQRPNLAAYLERAKARPSFKQAPVHLKVLKSIALPLILRAKIPFLRPLIGVKR